MGIGNLTVGILQQVGAVAMQYPGYPALQAGGMLAAIQTFARGFDTDHPHAVILKEGMEQAHGVGAATNTGDQAVGQATFTGQHLRSGFPANHRLKLADHGRIGVRSGDRADHVEGVLDIGDPVAQGLVHGVLEGAGAGGDGDDLGAHQTHARNVVALAFNIGSAHVDHAGQTKARSHRSRGDTVHAGTGLGNDPGLAHALGQQHLTDAVVDLVGAGMVQLFTLEVDLCPTKQLGQPLGVVKRAGAADEFSLKAVHFGEEVRLGHGCVEGLFKIKDQWHQ